MVADPLGEDHGLGAAGHVLGDPVGQQPAREDHRLAERPCLVHGGAEVGDHDVRARHGGAGRGVVGAVAGMHRHIHPGEPRECPQIVLEGREAGGGATGLAALAPVVGRRPEHARLRLSEQPARPGRHLGDQEVQARPAHHVDALGIEGDRRRLDQPTAQPLTGHQQVLALVGQALALAIRRPEVVLVGHAVTHHDIGLRADEEAEVHRAVDVVPAGRMRLRQPGVDQVEQLLLDALVGDGGVQHVVDPLLHGPKGTEPASPAPADVLLGRGAAANPEAPRGLPSGRRRDPRVSAAPSPRKTEPGAAGDARSTRLPFSRSGQCWTDRPT